MPAADLCRCPEHGTPLRAMLSRDNGPALLACPRGCEYPIRNGVPRFIDSERYAGSFGVEWLRFHDTQLDSVTGSEISARRLERCLGFPLEQLRGKRVLEIGCGSGRFTEVMLRHGAVVCALDMSEAVEAARRNAGDRDRCVIVQADALRAPFAFNSFDVVLCLGVLQHTPDPVKTVSAIARHVTAGGVIAIDNYAWTVRRVAALRYPLRFVIKHLPIQRAHAVSDALVRMWFPVHRLVGRRRWLHALVSRVSPITSYFHVYPELSDEQQRQFARLDTIDFYTPKYERLQTMGGMRRLLESAGLDVVWLQPGGNGIEARARRR